VIARLAAATILLVAGCGSSQEDASPAARIAKCSERFLGRVKPKNAADAEEIRRYAERAYCVPFEQRGWIYDDGTLTIEAHTDSGSEQCARAEAGEEARTVPCEELEVVESPRVLDCGLLHLVRRSDVSEYVAELQRTRDVRCDDGTPLEQLGAR
jgi:hypothetical protein